LSAARASSYLFVLTRNLGLSGDISKKMKPTIPERMHGI
jgi:hypothetical protein